MTNTTVAVRAGADFLLKSGDGATPEVFTVMGGLRSSTMTINGEIVDSTNHGSRGWKESVDGAGISSMTLSGSGLFDNGATLALARTNCMGRVSANYQITDGVNTFTGKFRITKMERAGDYKGDQTYSLTFDSNGPITIADAAV